MHREVSRDGDEIFVLYQRDDLLVDVLYRPGTREVLIEDYVQLGPCLTVGVDLSRYMGVE